MTQSTSSATGSIASAAAIGTGSNILAEAIVGAGALVLDDIPERVVAYGVPARVARTRAPGEPYL
jgi:acetyltransferase-like isoleucine patch superfamily enzyme